MKGCISASFSGEGYNVINNWHRAANCEGNDLVQKGLPRYGSFLGEEGVFNRPLSAGTRACATRDCLNARSRMLPNSHLHLCIFAAVLLRRPNR